MNTGTNQPAARGGRGRGRGRGRGGRGRGRGRGGRNPRWLREIRMLQRTTHLLIPNTRITRVIREVAYNLGAPANGFQFQRTAIEAIREATEAYIVSLMEDANLCAIHAHRVTIFPRDFTLTQRLRRE